MDKTPPHNIEAEQIVLGSIFRDHEVMADVVEIIKPEDFYRGANGVVFQAMIDLYNRNLPPNLIAVVEELKKEGKLEAIGGMSFVAQVANSQPTAAQAGYYAHLVKEKAIVRQVIRSADMIQQLAYSGDYESADELVNKAESAMFQINQKAVRSSLEPIRGLLHQRMDAIAERAKRKGISGIPTSLRTLDIVTSGFHPSELIIIAARPSMGKTSLAFQIGANLAIKHGKHIAIFSLEQDKERSIDQMLINQAMVDGQKFQIGRLDEDDVYRLATASAKLAEAKIYIDETAGISVPEIRSKCRKVKSQSELDLIIIDYLQLMTGHAKAENRNIELSQVSRGLKNIAKELKVPVIALSQLSREVERRTNKKPMLSDLRDSGALEQDSDLVLFIYRDEYYCVDTEKKGIAEIIIAKQRHGPTGTIELRWLENYRRFVEIDPFVTAPQEKNGTIKQKELWVSNDAEHKT